jgi:hypothetical protein
MSGMQTVCCRVHLAFLCYKNAVRKHSSLDVRVLMGDLHRLPFRIVCIIISGFLCGASVGAPLRHAPGSACTGCVGVRYNIAHHAAPWWHTVWRKDVLLAVSLSYDFSNISHAGSHDDMQQTGPKRKTGTVRDRAQAVHAMADASSV